jgi:hypothetical protein
MTFGYECRPSFWRTIRANSHLVIAAVGTASFLGVAGLALWLAMPSIERPAFADSRQAVVQQAAAAPLASQVAAATPEPAAAPRADEVTPQTAAAEAEIPVLKPNDVRWKDPNASQKPAPAPSPSVQAVNAEAKAADGQAAADTANSPLSAFAAANRAQVSGIQEHAGAKPDASETAAIPTARPQPPADKFASAAEDNPTQEGHILHGVTMRAGPKKGATALTTIPAKTIVQVVSCKQWCEVVYKGRHGWIYKSFVKRGD